MHECTCIEEDKRTLQLHLGMHTSQSDNIYI